MARKKQPRSKQEPKRKKVSVPVTETYKERRKRLAKAGYTDVPIPKGTKYKTKRGLRERAKKASVALIAKREGITTKQAAKKFKKAIIEVIYTSTAERAYRRFLEIAPEQYLEVKKGKPLKTDNTFGPLRKSPYIRRVVSLQKYWATVNLLAESWDITPQQARKYFKKVIKQFGRKEAEEIIYIDLGLYEEARKDGVSP